MIKTKLSRAGGAAQLAVGVLFVAAALAKMQREGPGSHWVMLLLGAVLAAVGLHLNRTTDGPPQEPPLPIFGCASFPSFFIFLAGWAALGMLDHQESWKEVFDRYVGLGALANVAVWLVLRGTLLLAAAGVIAGTLSLWRRERWPCLAVVGMTLNVAAWLWIKQMSNH